MGFKQPKSADMADDVQDADVSGRRVHWVVKDAILLACIGLAFFLFIVLFSYHPGDPGFDTVNEGQMAENYGGRTGAWISSLILYLFGIFGFLIPFGLLFAGMVTLKIRAGSEMDYVHFALSMLGLALLIVSGAGLAALYLEPHNDLIQLPYSGGGVLGYEFSAFLVDGIDLLGATLVLLVMFAIAFSMLTSFSWITIIDYTGVMVWKLLDKLKLQLDALRSDYEDKRQSKQEAAGAAESKAAKSPAILTPPAPAKQTEKAALEPVKKKPKVVEALAEKVKSKSKQMLEHKEPESDAPRVEPSIDMDKLDDSVTETEGASVKVGKKAISNSTVPEARSGELPSVELLNPVPEYDEGFSEDELTSLSLLLEKRLEEFGVKVKVEAVQPGPVVTRFEVLPAAGVKVSQINNLAKDLARVLSVKSVRVVDIIPGKSVVGIEIPNDEREVVSFREVISSDEFQHAKSPLTVALGKDIAGKAVVADIAKMPHLLVAGTTGSGKSVGVNSMILSMLYKSTPEEVRLIMVDPKMLELSVYEDIPHLLTPVVTDMSEAANALRWSVYEMDRRYQLMAKLGVRNIAGYNAKVKGAIEKGEPIIDPLYQQPANFGHEMSEPPPTLEPLPYIVVVVDEFADMIMVVGKEVEQLIARIAQKARAAGIHLILATQRPSVNVITGLIKANIPTRISFMVNTKIDSRTILDQGGAEQLLGMGDMLFMPPGTGSPKRVHGAFMTDEEVHKVAEFVKSQGEPQYLESVTQANSGEKNDSLAEDAEQDLLYDQVVAFVVENQRVSVSLVQRQFKIGYNRAARIVEAMESAGVVSPMKANGNRDVLAPKPQD
ncbi:DNA translocase FtsK [Thiomicrospira sp. XS5]|uniref:DNA translocase FtsK n=1 Tax=Thiomicrospira sp. XS5 TaxID=1775636 RepID=UPI0009E952A3|nr:DNA translocase FtsK [Thiomicrospira sp. XS5]